MENISKVEYLATLKRHHHNGRWEARTGRVAGNKYLYLGTFGTQEEAAEAYDRAAIKDRNTTSKERPQEQDYQRKTTKNRLKDSQIANTTGSGGGSPPATQMVDNHASRTTNGGRNALIDCPFYDEMKSMTTPQDSSRFNSGDYEKMELGFSQNDTVLSAETSGLNDPFFVKQESLTSSLPDGTSQPDELLVLGITSEIDEFLEYFNTERMLAAPGG